MTKKELYTSPEVDVFELRFESTLLTVSSTGNDILPGTIDEWPGTL